MLQICIIAFILDIPLMTLRYFLITFINTIVCAVACVFHLIEYVIRGCYLIVSPALRFAQRGIDILFTWSAWAMHLPRLRQRSNPMNSAKALSDRQRRPLLFHIFYS